MMQITSQAIRQQITSLDQAVEGWRSDISEISLAAAGGDDVARQEAAECLASIERAQADRSILTAALAAAIKREDAAVDAERSAAAAEHVTTARETATTLIDTARKADLMISEFVATVKEIARLEGIARQELRSAGQPPSNSKIGRVGLFSTALDNMARVTANILAGRHFEPNPKSVAEIATIGWEYLFEDSESGPAQ